MTQNIKKLKLPDFLNIAEYKPKAYKYIFYSVLFFFTLQALFFAIKVPIGRSFPDETRHFALIQIHKNYFGLPVENISTLWIGPFSRKPYLYHLIFGNLLYLNVFDINPLIFLRVVNALMMGGNLYLLWRLFTQKAKNQLIVLFAVVLNASTVMYIYISGAVNSDNLTSILSTLTIWLMVKIVDIKEAFLKKFIYFWLFLLTVTAGYLTKRTYMPVGFAAFFILIFVERNFFLNLKNYKELFNELRGDFKKVVLFIIALFTLAAGIYCTYQLHGVNLIKYRAVEPKCHQLYEVEECMSYEIFARDYPWKVVRDPPVRYSRTHYIFTWMRIMIPQFYHITSHITYRPSPKIIYMPMSILGLGLLLFIIRYKGDSWFHNSLILISGFHIFVLSMIQNYSTYLWSNDLYLSVQGRYWFPVLPFIYFIVAKYVLSFKRGWINSMLFWGGWALFLFNNVYVTYFFYQKYLA